MLRFPDQMMLVRDILVPLQGDYVLCVEIANWDFLHVGASKIAGISATPMPAPTNARARLS
jgi:hypothetical protein